MADIEIQIEVRTGGGDNPELIHSDRVVLRPGVNDIIVSMTPTVRAVPIASQPRGRLVQGAQNGAPRNLGGENQFFRATPKSDKEPVVRTNLSTQFNVIPERGFRIRVTVPQSNGLHTVEDKPSFSLVKLPHSDDL